MEKTGKQHDSTILTFKVFFERCSNSPFSRLKPVSHNPHIPLCSAQSTRYVISSVKELLQFFSKNEQVLSYFTIFFKFWIVSVCSDLETLNWPALSIDMHGMEFGFPNLLCTTWTLLTALHTVFVLDLLGLLLKMSF